MTILSGPQFRIHCSSSARKAVENRAQFLVAFHHCVSILMVRVLRRRDEAMQWSHQQ